MNPELIAPAGNWPMLMAAIKARADAAYFGVKQLNMRMTANNFELSELKKVVSECHKNKVKAYLTLNTIIYDNEIGKLKKILTEAKKAKIDAVIAWDFSVLKEANKLKIPIHLSTQASVSNYESAEYYYKKFGVESITLARELSMEQIKSIIQKINDYYPIKNKSLKNNKKLEIECFIHGAMCVSISGRCFLSQHLFNKSANRGECLQPCRRKYIVYEPEDKYKLALGEDYIMSPKDLCALPFVDKLIEAGISAFKIEGRNRSPEYVKTAVECYREAINNYKKIDKIKSRLLTKLKTVYNRGLSSGFYLGLPTAKDFTDVYGSKQAKTKFYVGKIKNYYKKIKVAEVLIENEPIKVGDELIIIGNKTGCVEEKLSSIEIRHKKVKEAKKGQRVAIKTNNLLRENDRVFVLKNS